MAKGARDHWCGQAAMGSGPQRGPHGRAHRLCSARLLNLLFLRTSHQYSREKRMIRTPCFCEKAEHHVLRSTTVCLGLT